MSLYCKHCGTENEEKYTYCKNCGTLLRSGEQSKFERNNYRYDYYADKIPDEIDGIPSEDFRFFVRKNQYKILDKFAKMSFTGSKLSWCWPAAILSFFFGFFGAAFWLFYRKMYRYGIIALTIGILLSGVTTAITYRPTAEFLNEAANATYELKGEAPNYADFEAALEQAVGNYTSKRELVFANFITEIANYSAALFYGLFGMYLYKKHSLAKITEYRTANRESVYYNYGLSALGGTTAGMAILAIIIAVTISNMLATISLFAFIF